MNDATDGEDALAAALEQFGGHLPILSAAKKAIMARPNPTLLWRTAGLLLFGVMENATSLARALSAPRLREALIMARTVLDGSLNLCFILAEGDAAAEKAQRHAIQRQHRELLRQSEIVGDPTLSAWVKAVDAAQSSELREALKEYTRRNGDEIRAWSSESVSDRVDVVWKKFGFRVGLRFETAVASIYDDASEVAHGSLFGGLLVVGLTQPGGPPRGIEDYDRYRRGAIAGLALMSSSVLGALSLVLASALPLQDLEDRVNVLLDHLMQEPWMGDIRERRV